MDVKQYHFYKVNGPGREMKINTYYVYFNVLVEINDHRSSPTMAWVLAFPTRTCDVLEVYIDGEMQYTARYSDESDLYIALPTPTQIRIQSVDMDSAVPCTRTTYMYINRVGDIEESVRLHSAYSMS
jgi:hypothetical protein